MTLILMLWLLSDRSLIATECYVERWRLIGAKYIKVVHIQDIMLKSSLELSIFIFLGQRALRKWSENTQRAIRALKSESYSRSLKYCVLLQLFSTFKFLKKNYIEGFPNYGNY